MEESVPAQTDGTITQEERQAIALRHQKSKATISAFVLNIAAAASVVNALIAVIGVNLILPFGLGITTFIEAMASPRSGAHIAPPITLLYDAIPIAFYILLAFLAKKHWGWYIAAIVCYLFDMGICLVAQLWLSVVIHLVFLYILWQGMVAARALRHQTV